jgi:hypothetical protein
LKGPELIAAALSRLNVRDKHGRLWQYHSRSDHHSKVACIAILLDLLEASPLLARHAAEGRVAFGMNHEMRDFRSGRKKDLDFVLCRPAGELGGYSLADLARAEQFPKRALASTLRQAPVGAALVALEAKACMTAHIKALPRLYDELHSSQQTVHGAAHEALAAGFFMVNAAESFVSPPGQLNKHPQPYVTERALAKVRELPRRSKIDDDGYDALGCLVIDCRNDGSPVTVVTGPPAPRPNDLDHYDRMIDRLATLYSSRFKEL